MFDDLLRQLDRIPKSQRVPIRLALDDEGYLDRRCPAEECGATFKVLFEDWREKVPDERAWCAICGEVAGPPSFNTPDQERQIRQQAVAHLSGQLDEAIRAAARPTIHAGFMTMTWSYRPGARPFIVPAQAAPLMSQQSVCEVCGCRYASSGAAFFCPACGHNSARMTFAGALATVRGLMDLADRMAEIVEDRDEAADQARQLAESSLARVWASFQRFAEATYGALPASASAPARRNAFQILEASDSLWREAIGKTYAGILSVDEHRDLVRLVQARHVLAHQDGLVDAEYVAKSGDHRYTVGQRLVVSGVEVRRLADLTEKLAVALTAAT